MAISSRISGLTTSREYVPPNTYRCASREYDGSQRSYRSMSYVRVVANWNASATTQIAINSTVHPNPATVTTFKG